MSTGRITRFGFAWGPVRVERIAHVEGRGYCIGITTDTAALDLYVSPKGRSIRIFNKDGAEWKPGPPRREEANRPAAERLR